VFKSLIEPVSHSTARATLKSQAKEVPTISTPVPADIILNWAGQLKK